MRKNERLNDSIRPITLIPHFNKHAEGSVLIKMGDTHVLCTASVEEHIPKWLSGSGQGWVTAEYGMLPRSTHQRMKRDKAANSGRTQEISRLIGRSLRAAVDLKKLGERQINIDCDVLQADGGTRTASVTGGFVALALALKFIEDQGSLKENPLKSYISAISIGLKESMFLLDLDYDEDSNIDTDMNFVMNQNGNFIEIQGTAEDKAFSPEDMNKMMSLANQGCKELFKHQSKIIEDFYTLSI